MLTGQTLQLISLQHEKLLPTIRVPKHARQQPNMLYNYSYSSNKKLSKHIDTSIKAYPPPWGIQACKMLMLRMSISGPLVFKVN